ncbi:QRFP-like peptide receptor isoform X1 [Centruroides sculpturatus]|uniref:QRFP-like peptide receptor isoform X1 n=1 Tax=Centruroides sculpturatus TaxID=218467 RepID=UPI000C6CD109|nr:QRFP-like peptide receptor isoform X1 [Centruroides sculpturatus]
MEDKGCNESEWLYLNFSSIDFPSDTSLREFTWKEYAKIVSYVLLMCATIVGNLGIVFVVSLNNSMRTTINIYLMNLAVADLLICLTCMWVHLCNDLTEPMYVLGPFMCIFNPFAQMTCLTASVLTLSAISCDRFIAIMFPLHVRITKQRTSAVITVIWIVSMLAAIPFPIYRTHVERQWSDFLEIQCSDVWPHEVVYSEELGRCIKLVKGKKIYYTFVTIALFFLPIVIMSTTYSLIVRRLWMSELPGERSTSNINIQHRAKKKVIKMVCVVLAVFVLCWMPLQIIVLYSQFGHKDAPLPEWFLNFNYFATFAAYSNSALNPIIYGGFNNNFRQAFLKLLKCSYRRRTFERPRSATQRSTTSLLFWKFSKNKTVSTFRLSS